MKTKQVFKAILTGVIIGAAIFFIPFPFGFFFIFFFIFFAFRFFFWGRQRKYWYGENNSHYFWNPSYTQRWRNMTEEERKNFIQKMEKELFATTTINNQNQ